MESNLTDRAKKAIWSVVFRRFWLFLGVWGRI